MAQPGLAHSFGVREVMGSNPIAPKKKEVAAKCLVYVSCYFFAL